MQIGKSMRHILGASFLLVLLFTAQAGFCGYTADCYQAPTWETGSWTKNDCLEFEAACDQAAKPATPRKTSNSLLAIVPPRQYAGSWPADPVNTARLHGGKISWEGTPESRASVWQRSWTLRLTWTGIIRVCSVEKTRAESSTPPAGRQHRS